MTDVHDRYEVVSVETQQVCDCPMDDKMGVVIHQHGCEYAEWLGGLFRDGE